MKLGPWLDLGFRMFRALLITCYLPLSDEMKDSVYPDSFLESMPRITPEVMILDYQVSSITNGDETPFY